MARRVKVRLTVQLTVSAQVVEEIDLDELEEWTTEDGSPFTLDEETVLEFLRADIDYVDHIVAHGPSISHDWEVDDCDITTAEILPGGEV